MPFIKSRDNQPLFIRDIGPQTESNKPPIILLHGFGMQSKHWLPFALPLANKQRFIIPDLRGFGLSHLSSHNQDCVISNYADDLEDIIKHLDLGKIKLAGISMGAFVALQYQAKYGDQHVSQYLHIDQSPKCLNDQEWRWGLFGSSQKDRLLAAKILIDDLSPFIENKTAYAKLPSHLRKEIWKNLGDFFASALSKPSHKIIARKICQQERLIKNLMPVQNWSAYMQCLKAYLEQDYDMKSIIENLSAPMSLIVGLRSEMYPCGGQLRIADYHSNCEVIPFNRSGHTPLIDQPIRFLKELNRFAQKT